MPTRKWGSEKLVNTTTAGFQRNSVVASLADGGFVIVWGTKARVRTRQSGRSATTQQATASAGRW